MDIRTSKKGVNLLTETELKAENQLNEALIFNILKKHETRADIERKFIHAKY